MSGEEFFAEPGADDVEPLSAFRAGIKRTAEQRPGLDARHWSEYSNEEGRRLVDSFVCFLDLLGTRGVRSDADAQAHLKATCDAMDTAAGLMAKGRPGRWFSDNLGTYIPITGQTPPETALPVLLEEAAAVQFALTAEGFAARGGIARGLFFADETFIHGPALERAYVLETQRAVTPRVVLDEASIAIATAPAPAGSTWRQWLLKQPDGTVFLDYIFAVASAPAGAAWIVDGLKSHRDVIQRAVHRFDGMAGVQEKYRWMAGYHNHALERLAPVIEEIDRDPAALRVVCSCPAGGFEEIAPPPA